LPPSCAPTSTCEPLASAPMRVVRCEPPRGGAAISPAGQSAAPPLLPTCACTPTIPSHAGCGAASSHRWGNAVYAAAVASQMRGGSGREGKSAVAACIPVCVLVETTLRPCHLRKCSMHSCRRKPVHLLCPVPCAIAVFSDRCRTRIYYALERAHSSRARGARVCCKKSCSDRVNCVAHVC
jgi:hypothetical protein